MLKAMGIEEDKQDQIIEAHTESIEALKKERDEYKASADMLESVQKELDDIKSAPGDNFQEKYESEHKAFEEYKAQVQHDAETREKTELYRAALKEAGVDEKRIESVLKVTDLDGIEMKDGALKDHDGIIEGVKKDWADFIVQDASKPANVSNPPKNTGGEKEPGSLKEALQAKYHVN